METRLASKSGAAIGEHEEVMDVIFSYGTHNVVSDLIGLSSVQIYPHSLADVLVSMGGRIGA